MTSHENALLPQCVTDSSWLASFQAFATFDCVKSREWLSMSELMKAGGCKVDRGVSIHWTKWTGHKHVCSKLETPFSAQTKKSIERAKFSYHMSVMPFGLLIAH